MNTALTLHHDIDAEARVLDKDLGKRLGYKQDTKVRELIQKNEAELQRYGSLARRKLNSGPKGGRSSEPYYLNEPQALLICMKSEAPVAADIRQEVIEVYMAFRQAAAEAKFASQAAELEQLRSRNEVMTALEYMTFRKEVWPHFMIQAMQYDAALVAAEKRIPVRKRILRKARGGVGIHNAYPVSVLEEAYKSNEFRLR